MSTEDVKNIAETAAWVCAGGFFLYRAFTGYLVTNLSLSVSCTRQASGKTGKDLVRVVILLIKGPSGTIALHDIQATVSVGRIETEVLPEGPSGAGVPHHMQAADSEDVTETKLLTEGPSSTVAPREGVVTGAHRKSNPEILKLSSTKRLSFDTDPGGRRVIKWDKPSKANAFMHLSPGESTHFATFCEVPSGEACTIDVAVLGRVLWTPSVSQWRASEVSVPLPPAE